MHKLITNNCNLCGAVMQPDKYDFYRCPDCGSEFWVKPFEKSEDIQAKQAASEYISRAMVPGAIEPGSSKSGKSGKERMKKRPTQKLYEQLFKQT